MVKTVIRILLLLSPVIFFYPSCSNNNPAAPAPVTIIYLPATLSPTPTGTWFTPTLTFTHTYTYTPVSCAPSTFGKTNIGSSTAGNGGFLDAARYNLSEAGVATGLSLYLTQASGQIRGAIYNDGATGPQDLLAFSIPQNASVGWNLMDIADTSLSAGTYWLAFQLSPGCVAAYDPGGAGSSAYYAQSFVPFPHPFPAHPVDNHAWSIYALYCPSVLRPSETPTSTPTPTPSFTPTYTPTITPTPTPESPLCGSPFHLGLNDLDPTTDVNNVLVPVGVALASPVTLIKTSKVTDMYVYITAAAPQSVRGAIYRDNNGQPGSLVVQTSPGTDEIADWIHLPVPDTLLYPGIYWLAGLSNQAGVGKVDFDLQTDSYSRTGVPWGPLPDPLAGTGSLTVNGRGFIYVNYCQQEPGTFPTPSPTSTQTPTETTTPLPTATSTPTLACPIPSLAGASAPGSLYGGIGPDSVTRRFTLSSPALITSVKVYVQNAEVGQVMIGIYSDNLGSPDLLVENLGDYMIDEIIDLPSWFQAVFSPRYLPAGDYWLAFGVENPFSIHFNTSPTTDSYNWFFWDGLTSPLNYLSSENRAYSIQILYCPIAGTPTPTITPTETHTETETLTDTPTHSPTPTRTLTPMPGSTCVQAPILDISSSMNGAPVTGSTTGHVDDYSQGGYGQGAPDDLYVFTLSSPQPVVLSLCGSSFDTTLYLRYNCGNASTSLGFNDDWASCGFSSRIETFLGAGTYYVVVDGYSTGDAGDYELVLGDGIPTATHTGTPTDTPTITATPTATPYCSQAPLATYTSPNGEYVSDDLSTSTDDYNQSGFGVGAKDDLYRVTIPDGATLEVNGCYPSNDIVVVLRHDCADPGTTLDWNYDDCGMGPLLYYTNNSGTQQSFYLIVDGLTPGSEGVYELTLNTY